MGAHRQAAVGMWCTYVGARGMGGLRGVCRCVVADAVLERGEKIELLVDKSEMLSKEAVRFKRQVGRTTGGHTPFSCYSWFVAAER